MTVVKWSGLKLDLPQMPVAGNILSIQNIAL